MRWMLCWGLLWLSGVCAAADWTFVTEDFPPFSYPQAGQLPAQNATPGAGPFVEIIEQACARLGHRCRVDVLPWRRALSLAEQGEVEGIFTVVDAPERREHFYISRMLVGARYSLFTREQTPLEYRSPVDLNGYHIGVYGPSGTALMLESLLRQSDDATLEMETDNPRALRKLAAGRYGERGAVLMNHDVALFLQLQEGITGLREAGTVKRIAYGIGLSPLRVSEAEFNAFDRTLGELQREGQVAAILKRHGLQPEAPQK